jgi:hypothetical protein
MCVDFIKRALEKTSHCHDHQLHLVVDVSEYDPLATLRLIQVIWVHKCCHILVDAPPLTKIIVFFASIIDQVVHVCFLFTMFSSLTKSLPIQAYTTCCVGADGITLSSLTRHAAASHLGTYYKVDGPLIQRILLNGGWGNARERTHY